MSNIKLILDKDTLKSLMDNDAEFELNFKEAVLKKLIDRKLEDFLTEEANKELNLKLESLLKTDWQNQFYGTLDIYANKFKQILIKGLSFNKNEEIHLNGFIKEIVKEVIEKELDDEDKTIDFRISSYLRTKIDREMIEQLIIKHIEEEFPEYKEFTKQQIKNKLIDKLKEV